MSAGNSRQRESEPWLRIPEVIARLGENDLPLPEKQHFQMPGFDAGAELNNGMDLVVAFAAIPADEYFPPSQLNQER